MMRKHATEANGKKPRYPDWDDTRKVRRYLIVAVGAWIIVCALSLTLNIRQEWVEVNTVALTEARSSFEKDLVYRRWASEHGGVYVPVTGQTPPNPYLKDIPERDIETPSGHPLTLINPAYMTRQVQKLGWEQYGSRGHITSLNPLRPENAADPWEAEALKRFEAGAQEIHSVETIDGKPFMRLMRPMRTEEGCLKCHAKQGYQVGQVRGGISVSVPMHGPYRIFRASVITLTAGHLLFCSLGIGGAWLGSRRLKRALRGRSKAARALIQAEAHYRGLFENSLAGVILFKIIMNDEGEPVDYLVLEANPAFERQTGHSIDEIVGEKIAQVFPEFKQSTPVEHFKSVARTGQPVHFAYHSESLDRHFDVQAFSPSPRHLAAVFSDITEHTRAEAELRTGEARYKLLAEHVQDVVWLMDIRQDRFLYVSPSVYALRGYTPEEVMAAPASEALTPASRLEVARWIAEEAVLIRNGAKREKKGTYVVEQPCRNGTTVWTEVTIDYVCDEDGEPIQLVGLSRDITERLRAMDALCASEARSRAIIEQTMAGYFFIDTDGRFQSVNPAWLKMHGYDSENEVIGRPFTLTQVESDLPAAANLIERALRGNVSSEGEFSRRCKNGSTAYHTFTMAPVERDGEIVGLEGFLIDITERKRMETSIRESDARYRNLFSAMLEGFAIHEMIFDDEGKPADYRFLALNPAFERLTGLGQEVVGRTAKAVIPALEQRWIETYGNVVLTGAPVEFEDHQQVLNRWYHVSAFRNAPNQFVCIFEDITARKHAEEEQERLRIQLIQAQKMEAVGQLAGGVAHDFNNLLQVIQGYTEIALVEVGDAHPAHDSMSEVSEASEKAAKLVSQLLAFSRRQIMRPESLDLNEVIARLLKMLKRVIGEYIRLDFIPGHQLGTIYADRGMMEQILMNLCLNGRDAMGTEGQLTIETGNVLLNGAFCALNTWASPGRYVLLTVTDTGCGMDAETRAHIFEPFFTTKEKGKGTGLGLATLYGIVRQHDGMIRVYSEPGKGAAFKVYLPVTERVAQHVIAQGETLPQGGTETILLAEDDENVRSLAKRILEQAGYTVLEASDGAEAVEVFDRHTGAVDLLLLDVVMPRLGGRDVYDRARALQPGIHALFASGYSENAIHTNFVLKEGMRLIQKPYNATELLRRIREILDEEHSR